MKVSMPKIFVTGGEGQLAQAYAKQISSKSDLYYIREHYNIHMLSKDILDITNIESFKSYINKHGKPEVIINCAAMTNVDKA